MRILTNLPAALKARFARLSLRGRITLALVAGSLLAGLLIASASFVLMRQQIINSTHALLDARAQLERREIEFKVGAVLAEAASLAANTVTANAFADSFGRETYLQPLLQNFELSWPGATLTLTDYRGETVAQSAPDIVLGAGARRAFARMTKGRAAFASIEPAPQGTHVISVAYPVVYRLTGSIEGAVLLQFSPEHLLLADKSDDWGLYDSTGKLLAGTAPPASAIQVRSTLTLPQSIWSLGLEHTLSIDKNRALKNLDYLLAAYLGVTILLVFGALRLSSATAEILTAPMRQLTQAAEAMADSGRPSTWIALGDEAEFNRLAQAFNIMVSRLRDSYAELEARVASRTREMETAKLAAEKASMLLQEAVTSVAQGFTIYDENDRLVLCNEAYLRFYDLSRDLIKPGATFEEIVRKGLERGQYKDPEAIADPDAWARHRVLQHQAANGEVVEQKLDDGRWLLIVEYRTPSGYIVGNRIDITELKQTTEALRAREAALRTTLDELAQSEERWQLAVSASNDGIWDWGITTGKAFFSTPWKAMLGYGPEDIGEHMDEWTTRVHPDDKDRVMNAVQSHFRRESEFYQAELRLRCKDGSYKWILCRGRASFDAEGRAVRMLGTHTDMTERRMAQAAVLDRNEQLNAIFELSPDGFISFDSGHRVKYASPAFTCITGIEQQQVIGLDETAFSALLDAHAVPGTRFCGVTALRETRGAQYQRVLAELATPARRVLEVGLRESQAASVSQILYFRDVTREVEVDRIKSEFLSTAAHELRTPMASIFGFSELLLTQQFDAATQRDLIETINRNADLMASIINELLDLARIEARRGKDFVFEPVQVQDLLRHAAEDYKPPQGREAPVLELPAQPVWVRADAKKMAQALGNVISNAYKYSPEGGAVRIFVSAQTGGKDASHVGLRVSDRGIGMSPEQTARVCERFYRADGSGKIPGTGLGMSIVSEILGLHGGRVEITSTPGAGTDVTLFIPAAAAPARPA